MARLDAGPVRPPKVIRLVLRGCDGSLMSHSDTVQVSLLAIRMPEVGPNRTLGVTSRFLSPASKPAIRCGRSGLVTFHSDTWVPLCTARIVPPGLNATEFTAWPVGVKAAALVRVRMFHKITMPSLPPLASTGCRGLNAIELTASRWPDREPK